MLYFKRKCPNLSYDFKNYLEIDVKFKLQKCAALEKRTKLCWNDPWVVPFQNVSYPAKTAFELYKHNDELFNIYYIFYELWTFAFWPIMQIRKKGGWN